MASSGEMALELFRAQLPPGRRGKPMLSKYDGECARCEVAILPGDPILWDGRAICQGCATDEDIDL